MKPRWRPSRTSQRSAPKTVSKQEEEMIAPVEGGPSGLSQMPFQRRKRRYLVMMPCRQGLFQKASDKAKMMAPVKGRPRRLGQRPFQSRKRRYVMMIQGRTARVRP